MASSRRETAAACSMLIVSLLAVGCSREESIATVSSETTMAPPSSSEESIEAAPTTFPSRDQIHGIVIARVGDNEIVLLDPDTGNYKRIGVLPPGTDANSRKDLSPDFQKIATRQRVNNMYHAGWLDTNGSFTDMTPELATDDFGSNRAAKSLGFDQKNRFYWQIDEFSDSSSYPSNSKFYRVDADNPTGPHEEVTQAEAASRRNGYSSTRAADGSLNPPDCVRDAYSSLAPDTYFSVISSGGNSSPSNRGRQIVRTTTAVSAAGECVNDKETPLLPDTSQITVTQPVPSPDGSKVAFFATTGALYIVDGFGKSRPVKVLDSLPDSAMLEWL